LFNGGGNTVVGNFIRTDPTGTVGLENVNGIPDDSEDSQPLFCEDNTCEHNTECTIDSCDDDVDTCSNVIDDGAACGIARK